MPDFQFEKNLVLNYLKELDKADPESVAEVINKYASPNFHLRCVHPFNDLIGAEKIASNSIKTNLFSISLPDKFGPTGTYNYLLEHHGLVGKKISEKIFSYLSSKNFRKI